MSHPTSDLLEQIRITYPEAWRALVPASVPVEGNCRSTHIGQLCEAMASAQGEIRAALKDRTVKMKVKGREGRPDYDLSYTYADLAEVYEACREPLARAGIAIFQLPVNKHQGAVTVVTLLGHKSEQWVQGELTLNVKDASDPKALGSAITYARRYALSAMVGVVTEDDDDAGAASQGKGKTQAPKGEQSPALARRQAEQEAAQGKSQQQAPPSNSPQQAPTKPTGQSEKPQAAANPSSSAGSKSATTAQGAAAGAGKPAPQKPAASPAKEAAWGAIVKVDRVYVKGNVAPAETIAAANVRLAKWGFPPLAECSEDQLLEVAKGYTQIAALVADLYEKVWQVDGQASEHALKDWGLTAPIVAERLAEWGKHYDVDLLVEGEAVLEQIPEEYLEIICARYDQLILEQVEAEKVSL